MVQSVNVPGIGQLNFPDGMSQPEMAAAIQKNFPQIHTSGPSSDNILLPDGAAQRMADDRAKRNLESPEKTFLTDSLHDKLYGPADAIMTIASSMGLGAVAPIVGFVQSAMDGKDPEKNASDFAYAHQFQPRTGTGAQLAELAGNVLSPLGTLPTSELANLHSALSSARAPLGQAGSAIADGIRQSNVEINAADAASKSALSSALSSAPATESTGGKIVNMFLRKQATDAATSGPQSAGAAASQHANMAEAMGASPEIQQMIADAEKAKDIHPIAAANYAEASSLPVPVDITAGMATEDAALASDEINNRAKYPEAGAHLNLINEQLAQNFDEIRNRVAPDVAARGVDLDQMAVDANKKVFQDDSKAVSANYKALADANGGDLPVSGKDFVVAADKALESDDYGHFLPAQVRSLMESYRNGVEMTFKKFETLRTVLASESRKAAGDGNARHAIGLVRGALEDLPMSNEVAALNLKPLADAARASAKALFEKVKANPALKAASMDMTPIGELSPLADGFIKKYVVNGKTANVQDMVRNLSGDPLNQQILAAGMIDHLKQSSGIDLRTNTGNVSQAALNKALVTLDKKTGIVLGRDALNTINSVGNVAAKVMKQSKAHYVNNSNTAVTMLGSSAKEAALGALNTITGGAVKPARAILSAIEERAAALKSIETGSGIKLSNFPAIQEKMVAAKTKRMSGPPTRAAVMPTAVINAPTVDGAIAAAKKAV